MAGPSTHWSSLYNQALGGGLANTTTTATATTGLANTLTSAVTTGGTYSYYPGTVVPMPNTFTSFPYTTAVEAIRITQSLETGWRYVRWVYDEATEQAHAETLPVLGLMYSDYVVMGPQAMVIDRQFYVTILAPNEVAEPDDLRARAQVAYQKWKAGEVARRLSGPAK